MSSNDPFRSGREVGASVGPFPLALLLLAVTIALSTGFSFWQALEDRNALRHAMVTLEAPHQQAARLRGQVEGIAKQVARLAEQGNPNAREVVEALRRQGVVINPN